MILFMRKWGANEENAFKYDWSHEYLKIKKGTAAKYDDIVGCYFIVRHIRRQQ